MWQTVAAPLTLPLARDYAAFRKHFHLPTMDDAGLAPDGTCSHPPPHQRHQIARKRRQHGMYNRPGGPPVQPIGDDDPTLPSRYPQQRQHAMPRQALVATASSPLAVAPSPSPAPAERPARLDERVTAAIAHLLVLFLLPGSLVAWMIWMVNRRRSPFIAYHARQAVLWQTLSNIVFTILLIIAFAALFTSFGTLVNDGNTRDDTSIPVLISSFFGIFALIVVAELYFWLTAFVGAFAALLGRRHRYPIVNRKPKSPKLPLSK